MSLSLPTQKADSFRFAPHSENTIVVKAFWEYVRSSEVTEVFAKGRASGRLPGCPSEYGYSCL